MKKEYKYDTAISYLDADGDPQTLYVSTHGRSTGPSEGPYTNVEMLGRLEQPADFDEAMYGSPTATRGEKAVGTGLMVIANNDGELDDLTEASFDDERIQVQRLLYQDGEYTSSVVSMFGYVEEGEADEKTLTLQIRDRNHVFDKPALPTTYAGTNAAPNGIEGLPTTVGGKQKPRIYGKVHNITPYAVNNEKLVYQVDASPGSSSLRTGWSLVVRDEYVVLTADGAGNYANQAAMEATAPAAGQYRVCPSIGCFRLGSKPTGKVTCDVSNPATLSANNEIDDTVRMLAANVKSASVSDSLLATVPSVGIYMEGEITFLQAINQIVSSANASWNLDSDSLITLLQLTDPSGETAGVAFTDDDIISLQRVKTSDPEKGKPVWRVTVKYKKNYTVMTEAEIAGSVSLDDRAYAMTDYLSVTATDTGVQTQYPNAPEMTVETLLYVESDAQDLADRLLLLHGVKRSMYAITLPLELDGTTTQLGDFIEITYPRFDLAAGKNFQIIGRSIDAAAGTMTLTVWG